MFHVKMDDLTLWTPVDNKLKIVAPTLKLEVNKIGSLSFKIYPDHPYYNNLDKMKSVISVHQGERTLFKGRVYSDNMEFRKVKKVEVEGVLGYLNDSRVRPYDFSGSVEAYFTMLVNQHNDQVENFQKFKVGVVTVKDANDLIVRASSNVPKTWDEINDKLIKLLGGYISIRYEADGNYIDYLADYTDVSTQDIAFSVNLLDLNLESKANSLSTCLIPYGAKDNATGEKVDITSVNNGVDYIYDAEAVARYGRIFEVVTWEDVTLPSNLLSKARVYLADKIKLLSKLTVKAIDLHLTDETIEAFKLGDYVKVYSKPHGIDERVLLTAYSMDLTNPSGCTITLGLEKSGFIDSQVSNNKDNSNRIDKVTNVVENTEKAVRSIIVLFYLSTSETETIGGSWSTDPPEWVNGRYYWQKIRTYYVDGTTSESAPVCITGAKGEDGKDGIAGKDGVDGKTTYFHVKYSAVSNPTAAQMVETPSLYIGTYVDYTEKDSTNPSDYTWSKFQGEDGIAGTNGIDGKTYYLHIRYSNDGGKTFTANNGETTGTYIGVYTDTVQADSSDVSKYKWSLIKGSDGTNGKDGVTYYTWIKYADTPTSGMSDNPDGKKYMGLAYNKTSATESSNYSDYTWSLIKGEDGSDGVNGKNGTDGKTYYTWVKYADNASGSGMSNDPTGKYYIGLAYNKTTSTESNNASDYTWSLFRGSDGVDGDDGSDGVGVKSIATQFYLSTSKTALSGGSWVNTMPEWSVGRFLWIRSVITYTDNSVAYTEPVCDSSWTAIEDIEIGGRNYLRKTDVTKNFNEWIPWNSTLELAEDGFLKITPNANASSVGAYPPKLSTIEAWQSYVVSFDAYATKDISMGYFYIVSDDGNTLLGTVVNITTTPKRYSFDVITSDTINNCSILFAYATSGNGSTVFYLRNPKLEKGNKATDWTPAPEDTTDELERNVEETRTYINEYVENSEQTTRTMLAEYAKTSDLESVREEMSTSISQTASDFTVQFDTVNERITNENGEIVRILEENSKYIRLVDGNIILGEQGALLTTKIANGRISFLYNDSLEVAYISEQKLYITQAEILESIVIGNFAFIPRANGNLSFKKI